MTKIMVNGYTYVATKVRKHEYVIGKAASGPCVDIADQIYLVSYII